MLVKWFQLVGEIRSASATSGGAEGEVGGFPGGEAAGDFGDVGEARALEEAGGDGGAVATGAVDEELAVVREFGGFLDQMS